MTVVVVGGGIVGLASGYYLAKRGEDVVVCEKGTVGSGSTERSAGGIRAQFSTPVNVDLSVESMNVWDRFETDFGVDIGHRKVGYLFLAREEATADEFREAVAMQNDRGVPSELLTPSEAADHCPALHAEEFCAATYSPTDGFADPYLALQGYATAAREAGVDVRTKTPVTAIHRESGAEGRVTGVDADGDHIEATHVVDAAGAWARDVAELADIDLPIAPRRRQALVVDPETPVPEDGPLTIDLDTGSYFRPEREGAAIVGGHFDDTDPDEDPDGYSTSIDLAWAATALERAADCAGYFGPDSRIRRGWAGLYAVTPDHHPIIEETAPGFVTAAGFSGHGFQHAPATGQLVAELVCDGRASLVDVDSLTSDRFADDSGPVERNVA
ncbi:sarcosine oxidase subunit beta [Halogranum gelatinilyticum]|uniref:Sarcosine oxidase subunit beta n=1 Tax=Halogranum gelatinilyticum TaxID=660521 RepID=A0A1H0A4A5_9EURY|nr:FAD-dependent oxidoreductase [Halogranum gelatinilyticum]SDN28378.1 sarcosine oxidase subunit beta [Halogranum gelatinilyticum]